MNDHLPFHDLLEDFQATLRRAGCLAFIVLVIGVFVPGLIQYKRGTFFREDIIEKIDNKDVMQKIKNYDKMHYEILKAINAIEDKIIQNAKNLPPEEILEFTKLYDQLDNFISQKRNPYHIATVYLDPLIVVWILFYISFTWLFFLLAPKIKVTLSPWEYFTFFIGIWLFFRFPTWMRNFTPFRNLDRKVYAGTNFDIDRVSFFTQEFQAAIVCFLITIVLLKWSSYFIMWRHNVISVIIEKGRDSTPQLIQAITRQFIHWQICSIFIAVAFIPWTYFFWRYVMVIKDYRYVYHAIIVHTIWGLVWFTITAPVFYTGYKLRSLSFYPKVNVDDSEGKIGEENNISNSIEGAIGSLNFIGSIIAACITFVAPILKSSIFG